MLMHAVPTTRPDPPSQSVPVALRKHVQARVAARLLAKHSGSLFASIVIPSLLNGVDEEKGLSLLELAGGLFELRTVKTDAVICRQGTLADAFYIMVRGSARVLVWLDTIPRQAVLAGNIRATEGGQELCRYFGEAGLLATAKKEASLPKRTSSIMANEPCLLLVLPRRNFLALTKLLPQLDQHFARSKVHRTRALALWQCSGAGTIAGRAGMCGRCLRPVCPCAKRLAAGLRHAIARGSV